jgi:hypothetical protein
MLGAAQSGLAVLPQFSFPLVLANCETTLPVCRSSVPNPSLWWRLVSTTTLFAPRLGVAYASHAHPSMGPFRVLGGSRFGVSSMGVDPRICQTFAASPAEPGELPFWFRRKIEGRDGSKGA